MITYKKYTNYYDESGMESVFIEQTIEHSINQIIGTQPFP